MQSKLSAWTQYNLGCNNTKRWTIKSLAPTHTYPVCFVIKFKGNFTTKPLWEGGVERWSFLSSLRMLLCPAEHRLASGAFWTRWSWRSSPTLMIPKPTSPCNRGNDVARPEEDKARQLNPPGHSPRPHQGQLSPRGAAHLFSAPRGMAQHEGCASLGTVNAAGKKKVCSAMEVSCFAPCFVLGTRLFWFLCFVRNVFLLSAWIFITLCCVQIGSPLFLFFKMAKYVSGIKPKNMIFRTVATAEEQKTH